MIYIKILNYNIGDKISIENIAIDMRQEIYASSSNIIRGKNGKPYFEDKKLYFNGSHSNDIIAVVLSDNDIGIDIEKKRIRRFDEIAQYAFSTEEAESIRNSKDKEKDFFILWTMKEAFLKLNEGSVTSIKNTPLINIENKKVLSNALFKVFEIDNSYILSISFNAKSEIKTECHLNTKEIFFTK